MRKLVSFLVLVVLTSACASRGQGGVQLTQACGALESVKDFCSSAINKPRQLQRVCDSAPLVSLLCATASQPSESIAASVRSNCPPTPSPECIGALVASQSWRVLTSERKKQLLICAEYINQTEACR